MANLKGSDKKKRSVGDFIKKRKKVGKTVQRSNVTNLQIKSKKINVPVQNDITSKENLSQKDYVQKLLKNCHHYSASMKIASLNELKQYVVADRTVEQHASLIIPSLMELLYDEDSNVRKALSAALLVLLKTFRASSFNSVAAVSVTYLCSGLTSIHKGIRANTLTVLLAFCEHHPLAIQGHMEKLLSHTVALLVDGSQASAQVSYLSAFVNLKASSGDKSTSARTTKSRDVSHKSGSAITTASGETALRVTNKTTTVTNAGRSGGSSSSGSSNGGSSMMTTVLQVLSALLSRLAKSSSLSSNNPNSGENSFKGTWRSSYREGDPKGTSSQQLRYFDESVLHLDEPHSSTTAGNRPQAALLLRSHRQHGAAMPIKLLNVAAKQSSDQLQQTSDVTTEQQALLRTICPALDKLWRALTMESSQLASETLSPLRDIVNIAFNLGVAYKAQAADVPQFIGLVKTFLVTFPHVSLEGLVARPGSPEEASLHKAVTYLDIAICDIALMHKAALNEVTLSAAIGKQHGTAANSSDGQVSKGFDVTASAASFLVEKLNKLSSAISQFELHEAVNSIGRGNSNSGFSGSATMSGGRRLSNSSDKSDGAKILQHPINTNTAAAFKEPTSDENSNEEGESEGEDGQDDELEDVDVDGDDDVDGDYDSDIDDDEVSHESSANGEQMQEGQSEFKQGRVKANSQQQQEDDEMNAKLFRALTLMTVSELEGIRNVISGAAVSQIDASVLHLFTSLRAIVDGMVEHLQNARTPPPAPMRPRRLVFRLPAVMKIVLSAVCSISHSETLWSMFSPELLPRALPVVVETVAMLPSLVAQFNKQPQADGLMVQVLQVVLFILQHITYEALAASAQLSQAVGRMSSSVICLFAPVKGCAYLTGSSALRYAAMDVYGNGYFTDVLAVSKQVAQCLTESRNFSEQEYFLRLLFDRRQQMALGEFTSLLFAFIESHSAFCAKEFQTAMHSLEGSAFSNPLAFSQIYETFIYQSFTDDERQRSSVSREVASVLTYSASSEYPVKIIKFLQPYLSSVLTEVTSPTIVTGQYQRQYHKVSCAIAMSSLVEKLSQSFMLQSSINGRNNKRDFAAMQANEDELSQHDSAESDHLALQPLQVLTRDELIILHDLYRMLAQSALWLCRHLPDLSMFKHGNIATLREHLLRPFIRLFSYTRNEDILPLKVAVDSPTCELFPTLAVFFDEFKLLWDSESALPGHVSTHSNMLSGLHTILDHAQLIYPKSKMKTVIRSLVAHCNSTYNINATNGIKEEAENIVLIRDVCSILLKELA